MRLPFVATGRFFAVEARMASWLLKILSARRFNFIITDVNNLKLVSFVKSNSSHTMQAVVEGIAIGDEAVSFLLRGASKPT
jgi:hypothetical protein